MKPTVSIFFSILIFNISSSLAQSTSDSLFSPFKKEILTEFKDFKDVHIGYYGTTQNCLPYNVHGFKYRRTWLLVANQESNLTFLVIKPPRTEEVMLPGSDFLFLGLGKTYTNNYLKLKKRKRSVKDVELYGFYKFKRFGRKSLRGLLFLEYPKTESEPPWPFKWLKGKAVEAVEPIEVVIPEINTDVVPPPPPIPAK